MVWKLVSNSQAITTSPVPSPHKVRALPPPGCWNPPPPGPRPPPPPPRARLSRSSSAVGLARRGPPGGCAQGLRGPASSPPPLSPLSSLPSSPPPPPHGLFGLDIRSGKWRRQAREDVMPAFFGVRL